MTYQVQLLAKLLQDATEAMVVSAEALNVTAQRVTELSERVASLENDVKELLDVTGITQSRWKAANKELSQGFLKDRMDFWRGEGHGYYESGQKAKQELIEFIKSGVDVRKL